MAEPVVGVLLSTREVQYVLAAFEVLLRGRRPSPTLADFIARLGRSAAAADVEHGKTCGGASLTGHGRDAETWLAGDVLDSDEAAAVLGITPAGVRDLARRGRLPAKRAGGRWVLHAASVVKRAEARAGR